jgi:hypothetical protein
MGEHPVGKLFTIMPFSMRDGDMERYGNDRNHWSEVYEGLIVPAAQKARLTPGRDDEDWSSRLITDHIWRKLEDADIILCDLSAANPNVFLELGWALRADKRFVLIKDEVTPFYFDLNQFYTYTYSHRLQPSQLRKSVAELAEVIKSTLADTEKRYSIVRKMSLQMSLIQATSQGNVEAQLLKELLDEVRGSRRTVTAPSMVSPIMRPRVIIFWHDSGLTKQDALQLVAFLDEIGAEGVIVRHSNPRPPDAIFISPKAHPELVRAVLGALSYPVRYIFPVDYPDAECGALSDFVMSVGIHSVTREGIRPKEEEPILLEDGQLESLLDPKLSSLQFRSRLYEISSA